MKATARIAVLKSNSFSKILPANFSFLIKKIAEEVIKKEIFISLSTQVL
jgi:hypothetical protein